MEQRIDYRPVLFMLGMTVGFVFFITVPVINYLLQVGLVLGFIYLTRILDFRFAAVAAVLLAAVLAVLLRFSGQEQVSFLTGSFLIETAGAGCLLGYGMKRDWPAGRSLMAAALPAVAVFFLLMGNIFNLAAPFEAQLAALDQMSGQLAEGASAGVVSGTLAVIRRVFPGINLVSSLINLLVVYAAAQAVAPRVGLPVVRLQPAALWQVPFGVVWGLAAGLALAIFGSGIIRTAGLNLVIVTGCLFTLQGWAIVRHFFVSRGVPKMMEYATYMILFMTLSVSPAVLGLIGLFDCWFNFRKLNVSDQPIKQGVK